jgi:SAM-dependent methyltransferase
MDRKNHWERVYTDKAPDEVSWYQDNPAFSLELIAAARGGADTPIIDVGGGASTLVDHLLDRGYRNLCVLDISAKALDRAVQRLAERARQVDWVQADVTEYKPMHRYAIWHDRAVFHFLVDERDRARYRDLLKQALLPGAHLIVATFAEDGPEMCSGLPVVRYRPETLQQALGGDLELLETRSEQHETPAGKTQSFVYCLFRWPD